MIGDAVAVGSVPGAELTGTPVTGAMGGWHSMRAGPAPVNLRRLVSARRRLWLTETEKDMRIAAARIQNHQAL